MITSYSASKFGYDIRLLCSLTAFFWLAHALGIIQELLKLITLHFIHSRLKLPIDLDHVNLRMHLLNGTGELEIKNLKILALNSDIKSAQDRSSMESPPKEMVLIKNIFLSFFTIQSLVCIVLSGGKQLTVDNVCIDGLEVNIEIINVVESDEVVEGGLDGSDIFESNKSGPKDLKQLLNIWLIANSIKPSSIDGNQRNSRGSPSFFSSGASRQFSFPETEDEECTPYNLTWRSSPSTSSSQANPDRSPPPIVVASSLTHSYSLPSILPTDRRRGSPEPTRHMSPTPSTGMSASSNSRQNPLSMMFPATALSSLNISLPPWDAPHISPQAMLQKLNDSTAAFIGHIQSGTWQQEIREGIESIEKEAAEFRDDVLRTGLIKATANKVRGAVHQARSTLDEELMRRLPGIIAELHAKIVGPDDPSWTRDILDHDRVWVRGCIIVLNVEIRLNKLLPSMVEGIASLEKRPVKIPRVVLEHVGRPRVSESWVDVGSQSERPENDSHRHHPSERSDASNESRNDVESYRWGASPPLEEGWALPHLQRKLEIAMVIEATRQNILSSLQWSSD